MFPKSSQRIATPPHLSGLEFYSKGMRKQSAYNLFFGEHFSSLANTFKRKKFHDLPDPRFPFEPLKLIEWLFCHGHYQDPFPPTAIKFAIEDLFPSPEIKLPVDNGHDHSRPITCRFIPAVKYCLCAPCFISLASANSRLDSTIDCLQPAGSRRRAASHTKTAI